MADLVFAPMRRSEPLTDARLLGPGLLAGYGTGLVATPVRIADADAAKLLSPGDVIDVLAVPTGFEHAAPSAQAVAHDVRVITRTEGEVSVRSGLRNGSRAPAATATAR